MKIKTTVPIERLKAIAAEEGCALTEKATCVMVKRGASNNRLYIARTANVGRININGFKCPDPEVAKTPDGGPVGTFLQSFRFDHDEATVLKNWRAICRGLDAYESAPRKPRGRPAGFRGSKREAPKGPSVEVQASETAPQHAERLIAELQKKRELAKRIGFPLSPKTVEAYRQKLADLGHTLEA